MSVAALGCVICGQSCPIMACLCLDNYQHNFSGGNLIKRLSETFELPLLHAGDLHSYSLCCSCEHQLTTVEHGRRVCEYLKQVYVETNQTNNRLLVPNASMRVSSVRPSISAALHGHQGQGCRDLQTVASSVQGPEGDSVRKIELRANQCLDTMGNSSHLSDLMNASNPLLKGALRKRKSSPDPEWPEAGRCFTMEAPSGAEFVAPGFTLSPCAAKVRVCHGTVAASESSPGGLTSPVFTMEMA